MCGIVGIANDLIQEIKWCQPNGPYHIGGWSSGIVIFEIVRQLIDMGGVVKTLTFIDTWRPLIIEPLPGTSHRFFSFIGLVGERDGAIEKFPPWLVPRFPAPIHALLSTYEAVLIDF